MADEHDDKIYQTLNDHHQVVVIGTDMLNCILSGLLSIVGMPTLTIERKDKYGGECQTMDFNELNELFKDDPLPLLKEEKQQWNVDKLMKFMFNGGDIVKIMKSCSLHNHIELLRIMNCFTVIDGQLVKVPKTKADLLATSNWGWIERGYMFKFMYDLGSVDMDKGIYPKKFTDKNTMAEVYQSYGLSENMTHLVGHVVAMQPDDDYLKRSCTETLQKIQLFVRSYNDLESSPFSYPAYGISDVPQAFSMRASTYQSEFGLNFSFNVVIDEEKNELKGIELGVKEKKFITTDYLITDAFTLPQYMREVGKIIRCICILKKPMIYQQREAIESAQIVVPGSELNKKSDCYIGLLSSEYRVCPKGYYIAIAATLKEKDDPEQEIAPALRVLGEIYKKHISVDPWLVPIAEKLPKNVFITSSCDPQTHYETMFPELKKIYQQVTKKPLNLSEIAEICKKAAAAACDES